MTGWIIYNRDQLRINRWFADELLRHTGRFASVRIVILEELSFGTDRGELFFALRGAPMRAPDFAVVRAICPLLSETLEEAGTRVFNRACIARICNDKRLTHKLLRQGGVPSLRTVFCEKRFFDPAQAFGIDYPLVLKGASGHGGREVWLVRSGEELAEFIKKLPEDGFLLQELLRPYGRDLRAYVLGGEILGAVLRSSEGFRSNYSLGGKAVPYALNDEERALVRRVLRCLPCPPDYIGVDLLPGPDGLICNEIEDVVGARMLYDACRTDAAALFCGHIQASLLRDPPAKGN